MQKLRTLLLMILFVGGTGLLAACGSSGNGNGAGGPGDGPGGGDGDDGTNVSRIGFFTINEADRSMLADDASAYAGFMRIEGSIPVTDIDPADQEDTCFVYDLADPPELDFPLPDIELSYVGAGEQLTIESAGMAYAVLDRQEETIGSGTFITYELPEDEPLTPPVAGELTLTVPGSDDFPSFTDVQVPDVPAFSVTQPADSSVDADTTFTWTGAEASGNSFVTFDVFAGTNWISCTAEDDGSFSFPSETVAELGGSFSGTLTEAIRTDTRSVVEGNAVLYLMSERTLEF